jgi:hypothetical protein
MRKTLKTIKTALVMGILLVSVFVAFAVVFPNSNTASAADKAIAYPAYIDISISDESLARLNEPIGVEEVLSINVDIKYTVAVPKGTFDSTLLRLWVFNSFIVFPQMIHLEIVDSPDWATVYFSSPDLQIDFEEGGATMSTTLVVVPLIDATAEPADLLIKATAGPRGRIEKAERFYTIPYEPGYIPLIYITVDKPTREASPRENLNFKMTIENKGNKETIVKVKIIDAPSDWAPLLSSSSIPISAKGKEEVTFSVVTPYNFGWHNELRSFTIEFTPEKYPPSSVKVAGTPEQVQVRVNSVGFSVPGFELVGLVIAIGIVVLIARRKYRN